MKNSDYMTKKDREDVEELLRKGNAALICILIVFGLITILSFF
jgi:hypothetical protein